MKHEDVVKEVSQLIKNACLSDKNPFGESVLDHIKGVVKYSLVLAEKLKADKEVVEIASWLHDYGSVTGNYKDHHITGAKKAEEILNQYHYPKNKIENIKHCIYVHRTSQGLKKETVEAEIVASADLMAEFDEVPALYYLAYHTHKFNHKDGERFVLNKVENGMNKVMPEGREIIKEKYGAFKLLLKK